jgi:hypothetical protein
MSLQYMCRMQSWETNVDIARLCINIKLAVFNKPQNISFITEELGAGVTQSV